jgi:hypothetical protein
VTAPLRERLHWHDGAVHDGPRRYLMMRPDVLMGAVAALDDGARAALLAAWASSTQRHGGASLQAYAQQVGGDAHALMAATSAAAADLGWGDWALRPEPWGLSLQVAGSPFVDGWRSAAGVPAAGPVCAPIRGMLAALAGLLTGGVVQVDEVNCAATQADGACHCRFEARRSA